MNTTKITHRFLSAFLAGVCIAIGGSIFLSVDNKVIGATLFTIGLFCVCTQNLFLYTGKICYARYNTKKENLLFPVILFGNFMGTFCYAKLLSFSRNKGVLMEKANSLCEIKQSDDLISLFILGIVCNIFIFIAVHGFKNLEHKIGKYLSLFFGVMGFILVGSEHCVADAFYFSIADRWNEQTLTAFVAIVLGNTVGGMLAEFLLSFTKKKEKQTEIT